MAGRHEKLRCSASKFLATTPHLVVLSSHSVRLPDLSWLFDINAIIVAVLSGPQFFSHNNIY
jgi:hypothetical protein